MEILVQMRRINFSPRLTSASIIIQISRYIRNAAHQRSANNPPYHYRKYHQQIRRSHLILPQIVRSPTYPYARFTTETNSREFPFETPFCPVHAERFTLPYLSRCSSCVTSSRSASAEAPGTHAHLRMPAALETSRVTGYLI